MKSKTHSINGWIDAALLAGFVLACFLDLTGQEVHQWLGLAIGGLALYHLWRHQAWVLAAGRRWLSGLARLACGDHAGYPGSAGGEAGRALAVDCAEAAGSGALAQAGTGRSAGKRRHARARWRSHPARLPAGDGPGVVRRHPGRHAHCGQPDGRRLSRFGRQGTTERDHGRFPGRQLGDNLPSAM
jgi:hypothetical protein